ncbi:hypothetical protein [Chondromyces apiculatus]|nr:hypothetical protein [Chondromyces apiculatus]
MRQLRAFQGLLTRGCSTLVALSTLTAAACTPTSPPEVPPAPDPPPDTAVSAPAPGPATAEAPLNAVPRLPFNEIAQELDLPLFWVSDSASPGKVEPSQVVGLWTRGAPPQWVEGGRFTQRFRDAYTAIARVHEKGLDRAGLPDAERRRREAVEQELAQGRPSLVRTDLRQASAEDQALVRQVLTAAATIERIYLKQRGAAGLAADLAGVDPASRTLFFRNQGPWCAQPRTEQNPDCSALPSRPPRIAGMYPASLQQGGKFCEALEKRPDQATLLSPFTVVTEAPGGGNKLQAVPYTEAYREEMTAVSGALKAAAAAIQSPSEAALKAYLLAAAQAFLDNRWELADEAWSRMNAENSRWYLRIGPDETYADPCSRKAGFHVSFARINQASLEWQRKLDPRKAEMEEALAKLAGAPYKARKVSFHLPDFIDIVINAGDSRSPSGATVGQSLPNWGKVANEGRGRTVAMTNLFEDEDSLDATRATVESLICRDAVRFLTVQPGMQTMSTVLHEAAHNLGPSHEYRANGKTDDESFGGPLAATLEELKAQTSALYFASWLKDRSVIDQTTAERALAGDVLWAFGQISQGMTTSDGKAKPYPQLAAIQAGRLLEKGVLTWRAEEAAANGKDKGCFTMDMAKFPGAVEQLAREVLGIKARGDKAAALKLKEAYVDRDGPWKTLRAVIQERALRSPKGTLVYSVELP